MSLLQQPPGVGLSTAQMITSQQARSATEQQPELAPTASPAVHSEHPNILRRLPEIARVEEKLAALDDQLIPKLLRGTEHRRSPVAQSESPKMRHAAMLLAANMSNKQVAEICGVTSGTITNWKATPWFQELVVKLINERAGGKDLIELFKASAQRAYFYLDSLIDDPKVKVETKVNNAWKFVEQAYGKATQKVEVDATVRSADPVQEARQLQEQIVRDRETLGLPPVVAHRDGIDQPAPALGEVNEAETAANDPAEKRARLLALLD